METHLSTLEAVHGAVFVHTIGLSRVPPHHDRAGQPRLQLPASDLPPTPGCCDMIPVRMATKP